LVRFHRKKDPALNRTCSGKKKRPRDCSRNFVRG
jgi:hypothetical protein